jgi:hypothetical protein
VISRQGQFLHPRSQAGQAIVLVAFMIVVLIAGVGIAVDAGVGYYYNTSAERAAAAAALSGVIFMPGQFCGSTVTASCATSQAVPAGTRNDASDRAVDESKRNGFDPTDAANQVTVTPNPVAGFTNKLQVQVTRRVNTFFMGIFGVGQYTVSRTAIATYLPPLSLGQPGNQTGSTVSQLGSGGSNYFFMRNEGWAVSRDQGDPFTPNPADPGNPTYASNDVHQISASTGSDTADPSLPSRGGYNYLITIPAGGGSIQVYNPADAPDGNGSKPHNNCENNRQGSPTAAIGPCSSAGSYYLHEEDGINFSDKTTFNAEEITLFQVNSYFIRGADTKVSQFKVLPIDASNWNQSSNQYVNVNTGANCTQTYNANGSPSNMSIYHSWVNVSTYAGAADCGLVQWSGSPYGPKAAGTLLPAGTYRLRIDSLNYDGSLPPPDGTGGTGQSHKGWAVRVLDATGNGCAGGCSLGAWDDMTVYTPISIPGGGAFAVPIFSVPPDYAGQTITLDIYDPGDISGGGNVDLYVLDPSGAVLTSPTNAVVVYRLGSNRNNASPTVVGSPLADPSKAFVEATTAGSTNFNGQWLRIEFPVPASYNPGTNNANWWWSLQYRTTNNVTATDTLAFAIGLKGNPAHLLQS